MLTLKATWAATDRTSGSFDLYTVKILAHDRWVWMYSPDISFPRESKVGKPEGAPSCGSEV